MKKIFFLVFVVILSFVSVSALECGDTIIGGGARGVKGISGGEMKRLAIATELLSNPSLPTHPRLFTSEKEYYIEYRNKLIPVS